MARKHDKDKARPSNERAGLHLIMGDLEAEIMECVWELKAASVKDVHRCLSKEREIAYTTVMTVMSRLAGKGYLVSRPEGRAYIYQAARTREALCGEVMRDFVSGMVSDADRQMLTNFVDGVTCEDAARLDLLAGIIEEKRRGRSSS